MIDGIIELPDPLSASSYDVEIQNVRAGHVMTDTNGMYVEILLGRNLKPNSQFHRYKLFSQDHMNYHEYIFLTEVPLDLNTLRCATTGRPVVIYPILYKRIDFYKKARPIQAFYLIEPIQELFRAHPELLANSPLRDRNIIGFADFLAIRSAQLFDVDVLSILSPEYAFGLQPVLDGEIQQQIDYLTLTDTCDRFLIDEWRELIGGNCGDPQLLMKYFLPKINSFNSFTLWFSKVRVSTDLVPHLSCKYRNGAYSLFPYFGMNTGSESFRCITTSSLEPDQLTDMTPAEVIIADAIGCNCTEFNMSIYPTNYEPYRESYVTYAGRAAKVKALYNAHSAYTRLLAQYAHPPYSYQVTKTAEEGLWIKCLDDEGSLMYMDLIWWLLASGDLINASFADNLFQKQYHKMCYEGYIGTRLSVARY